MIKRLLLVLLVAMLSVGAHARLIKGEKSFGPKLGYVSVNRSAVAGLVFQYNFNSFLRISPEVGVAFRHHNRDALLVDLNFETPFSFSEAGNVFLYPLAGLTFASWSNHGFLGEEFKDVTTHNNRLGANLGAGFDLRCSPTLKINIEAKYTLVKSYSGVLITAGIAYLF